MMIICIDIGATHTRVAFSEDNKSFYFRDDFETSQNPNDCIEKIVNIIENNKSDKNIEKIVIGVPGIIENSIIVSSPNLPLWNNFNLKEKLLEKIQTDIYVINDALLGALGEAVYGAGKEYRRVGFITVSTGLGGALIIDKKIDQSNHFEPGREILDVENNKTLEDLVSGSGVYKETGKKPKEITDSTFWDKKAQVLAIGLTNIINLWSPDILIVGGPMVLGKPSINLAKTIEYMNTHVNIVSGQLENDTGLMGGLAFVSK